MMYGNCTIYYYTKNKKHKELYYDDECIIR